MSHSPDLDEALQAVSAKLVDIRARERDAQNLVDFFAKQRQLLEEEHAALRRKRCPVLSLPPELLLLIFLKFVRLDDSVRLGCPAFFARPTVLSHVCWQWRTIVLATSCVWSTILFHKPEATRAFLDRSGCSPIDVLSGFSLEAGDEIILLQLMASTHSRLRSLDWSCGDMEASSLLLQLFDGDIVFPALVSATLARSGENISASNALDQHPTTTPFPALETLSLIRVTPSELPPVIFPKLTYLGLSFPATKSERSLRTLRMSNLCPLLSRVPELEELVLNYATPLLDVRVVVNSGSPPANTGIPHGSRISQPQMSPIQLQRLSRFTWSCAPPRDLWLWFLFIDALSLQKFQLSLDLCTQRWEAFFNDVHYPLSATYPILGSRTEPVINFTKLDYLYISCRDTDGLCAALKKMTFPALKTLALEWHTTSNVPPPQLPRLESIFRDPRLPHLTTLRLERFELPAESTAAALRYMQCLVTLTLDACPGAGALVCALAGGPCAHAHANPRAGPWLCPRLTRLHLVQCADVRFRCLGDMVRARRAAAGGAGGVARAVRPVRRLRGARTGVPPDASVNGGAVPGWNPHEVVRPAAIELVHALGCRRVSQAEMESLGAEEWGVADVCWR